MNFDKTEVMWVGKQRDELNIMFEGKYIKQVNNCVYLGRNISEKGEWMWRCDAEYKQERMHGEM